MNIINFETLPSSNSYVISNFDNLQNGDVILVKNQTNGRGRFDRKWISGNCDNIAMTIVCKNQAVDFPYVNLTQFLSVVIVLVLKTEFNIDAKIKWPNDVLVSGRKICGILAEAKASECGIKGVALGLGFNINLNSEEYKENFSSISLKEVLNKDIDTLFVVEKFLKKYEDLFPKFANEGFRSIIDVYEKFGLAEGSVVKVRNSNNDGDFIVKRINLDGSLEVKDEFGNSHKLVCGDIIQ